MHSEFDDSASLVKPVVSHHVTTDENAPAPVISRMSDDSMSEGSPVSVPERLLHKGEILEKPGDIDRNLEENASLDASPLPADAIDEDLSTVKLSDGIETNVIDSSSAIESDQIYPDVPIAPASEDTSVELPPVPTYVDLSKEEESNMRNLAIKHIIESYKHLSGTDCQQICMPLLARLVAQVKFFQNK